MRLVFDNVASPSGLSTTPQPSPPPLPRVSVTPKPYCSLHKVTSCATMPQFFGGVGTIPYLYIAKTTRSQHSSASQFAGLCQSLARLEHDSTDFACLCTRLTSLDKGHSLAVLDKEFGQLLKHCQLWQDSYYKEVWGRSYSNYGCLCQGIGTGDKAGSKQVAGTNTFHLIQYSDIPHHKHKESIYTKVVCEIQEGKNEKNCARITVMEI